jgi:hypothetical protein
MVLVVNVRDDLSGDEVEDGSAAMQAGKRSLSEPVLPSLHVDQATSIS